MKNITLTISDIGSLTQIQQRLSESGLISIDETYYLANILSQLPTDLEILDDKVPMNESFQVFAWDTNKLQVQMTKWCNLFSQTPEWNYTGVCCLVDSNDKQMLSKNVIAVAQFAPSMSYNLDETKEGFEVWLKDNGTAEFWVPTLIDARQYPELYNFKGSWKEAYYLLIETLKKGWPMEEFPEELQQFLKK